jgi:ATP-dependent helicase STH1/SNF2
MKMQRAVLVNVVNCSEKFQIKRFVSYFFRILRPVPDHLSQFYADYYTIIRQPIALSLLRKRGSSNYYKNVQAFRDDWMLMFNNAKTYNQEGSWVYTDAVEMQKVFEAGWQKHIAGTDMPGVNPNPMGYEEALTPMDEDERPAPPSRGRSGRKQVLSDDYLTSSEEE